jgi:hypothetical protein
MQLQETGAVSARAHPNCHFKAAAVWGARRCKAHPLKASRPVSAAARYLVRLGLLPHNHREHQAGNGCPDTRRTRPTTSRRDLDPPREEREQAQKAKPKRKHLPPTGYAPIRGFDPLPSVVELIARGQLCAGSSSPADLSCRASRRSKSAHRWRGVAASRELAGSTAASTSRQL